MNTIKKINYSIFILSCIGIFNAGIAMCAGTTGCNFLKIGVGSRYIGMGETGAAVSSDVNGIYWNPAGLNLMSRPEISFMHNQWFQNIYHDHIGYAHPLGSNAGVVAGSVSILGMNTIDGYDEEDNPAGSVMSSNAAASISYARKVAGWAYRDTVLSGGLSLKVLQEKLDNESAMAYGADIGLLCKMRIDIKNTDIPSHIGLGLVVQNLGTEMTFINEGAPLPMNYKIGASFQTLRDTLIVGIDYNIPLHENAHWNMGVESKWWDIILFRLGYAAGLDLGGGIRMGVGFNYMNCQMDYAHALYGDLGSTHRITAGYRFEHINLAPKKQADLSREVEEYNQAKKLFEAKQYINALDILETYLEYPKRYPKATRLGKKIRKIIKKLSDPNILYGMALTYYERGRFQESSNLLTQAMKSSIKHEGVKELYQKITKKIMTLEKKKNVSTKDDEDKIVGDLFNQANKEMSENNYKEAIKTVQKILLYQPYNHKAEVMMLHAQNKWDEQMRLNQNNPHKPIQKKKQVTQQQPQ